MKTRVISVFKEYYTVRDDESEYNATLTGKLIKTRRFPVVGDYVEIRNGAQIKAILPRKTTLTRVSAGRTSKPQIIVSNVDFVFIVTSLNKDFNVYRLERYLSMVYDSGATPCIILTKSDLVDSAQSQLDQLAEIAPNVDAFVTSCVDEKGIDAIRAYLKDGVTIGLIGSSGVGKSTLLNELLGYEHQFTMEIREGDDKGRHATTTRELFAVEGGFIIDTPGMRELQVHGGDLREVFSDVEAIAANCKFNDCMHQTEPGCAVRVAVEAGELGADRVANFIKLTEESKASARRAKGY